MAAIPLLRAPPFPGVARAVRSVTRAGIGATPVSIDDRRRDAVLDAARAARVGGTFWAPCPPTETFDFAVRVCVPGDLDMAATLAGDGAALLWILPRTGWARRLGRRLRGRGAMVAHAPLDPWSVLGRGAVLIAHGDDEWCAIARIMHAPLRLLSSGRHAAVGEDDARTRARIADTLIGGHAYRDVFDDHSATAEETIALLSSWRQVIDANRDIAVATGFALWKRREIARFLYAGRDRPLRFVGSPERALLIAGSFPSGDIAVWPSRVSDDLLARAAAARIGITRVEDGFIRSVGLGSNLVPPHSVTVDVRGIHYDPATPSDLETLLGSTDFPFPLLERADALIQTILAARLGKYGAADAAETIPPRLPGRRLVLVAGQVEDDLSVLRGGGDISGNLDLLGRVRALEPDAEIWFRPHPDIDAGHRRGAVPDRDALVLADRVVREGGMATLLDRVDAVHVLTSLAGFEALLRRREVVTHGTPFYAGWGLTRDLAPSVPRRRRALTLEQLVAGALILFPRYLDPVTGLPCPVETLVSRFAARPAPRPTPLVALRMFQGVFTKRLA